MACPTKLFYIFFAYPIVLHLFNTYICADKRTADKPAGQKDTMGAMSNTTDNQTSGQTIAELCGQHGRTIEAVGRQWARKFGTPFVRTHVPTDAEFAALFGAKGVKQTPTPTPERVVPPTTPTPQKQSAAKPVQVAIPGTRRVLLWACLLLSLGCTVPNMYGVFHAIKGNEVQAAIVTAALTIAPFLLIGANVGKAGGAVAYGVIAIEVFCNAAGFFGGMTGLDKGVFVAPTPFLNMVAGMVNSSYEGTALLLSLFMAAGIASIAAVPVYHLRK